MGAPDFGVSTSVDDSDERSVEFVREPLLLGGQLSRVSPGWHAEGVAAGSALEFGPESARRMVPVLPLFA